MFHFLALVGRDLAKANLANVFCPVVKLSQGFELLPIEDTVLKSWGGIESFPGQDGNASSYFLTTDLIEQLAELQDPPFAYLEIAC